VVVNIANASIENAFSISKIFPNKQISKKVTLTGGFFLLPMQHFLIFAKCAIYQAKNL